MFIPREEVGLEMGEGTGRFTDPLGIKVGVDPVKSGYREGEFVVIKGSRIDFEGEPAIIAAEVEKKDQTLEKQVRRYS